MFLLEVSSNLDVEPPVYVSMYHIKIYSAILSSNLRIGVLLVVNLCSLAKCDKFCLSLVYCQEANKMVQDANLKRIQAEKLLKESNSKVRTSSQLVHTHFSSQCLMERILIDPLLKPFRSDKYYIYIVS